MKPPRMQITLAEWGARYEALKRDGLREPSYGGPLQRHIDDGDLRLRKLKYDDSPAALRLWNFLLTEEERLLRARADGKKLVGAMKDLGTVPVMAYSSSDLVAFYPDGAWWIPCVMELNAGLLEIADSLGIDEAFCPVRAMLGAFVTGAHFPIPDLLTCSVGATCDDFSAIAQRLNGLGYPIVWWEIPHRRRPEAAEKGIALPGGFEAPRSQVDFVREELERVRDVLGELTGQPLTDEDLCEGIRVANRVRRALDELRASAYGTRSSPMPALEMLIAEMLAIHFCSDRDECVLVLEELLAEVRMRIAKGHSVLPEDAVRVFWVNPVADLRAMNVLEESGGRVCGTDYLFCHALDAIPEDLPPTEALARMALADPMVGPASDRADRICADAAKYHAECVIFSRIPGASHCATEGAIIAERVRTQLGLPTVELEVAPILDPMEPTLRTRMEALMETVRQYRRGT